MRAKTVGFAIADEDRELLERLVDKYGNGNRSEFLRVAMKHMAKIEFAERFNDIRAELAAERGDVYFSREEIEKVVREVKGKSVE